MHQAFTIHYCDVSTKNRLRHRMVTLKHSDHRQVSSWIKTLKSYLKSQAARPKKLIVFVNPFGGKKQGLQIFKKQMEPLLQIAEVTCTMVLTEAPNHAFNMLVSIPNLAGTYDGVACIGGDGTFSEGDVAAEVPKPKLSIGLVPGGSTDTVAFCMHGTNDVQTAILHIILGDKRGMDLCGLRTNEKHLRFVASVISYGYLGDVMKDSENYRWMGPKRYEYSGFKKFFANRGYEGELKMKLKLSPNRQSDPSKGSKCQINCPECSLLNDNIDGAETNGDLWKTVKGKFFMVSGANLSCLCPRSPNGIAPFCHSGNDLPAQGRYCMTCHLWRYTEHRNSGLLLPKIRNPAAGTVMENLCSVQTCKSKFIGNLLACLPRARKAQGGQLMLQPAIVGVKNRGGQTNKLTPHWTLDSYKQSSCRRYVCGLDKVGTDEH
ncbi:Hypothetical predicted protein [Cloeon dipterum]|uniref:DAGKc domain-containing protein n=1 Tax=Cloeon dipterum TaxID=197152 RepID=A0A8S1CB72_9INSE|nr:Hypothetical predicted protein [Cloeon dipterum]